MDYSVNHICAHINVERTKVIYRSLVADSNDNSAVMNFRKNIFIRKKRMEEYLTPLGIDISKYQGLDLVSISQKAQSVTYCGYYPLYVENIAELKSIIGVEYGDSESRVNKTNFGFEFSLEYVNDQIVLFFWAVLPWFYMFPIQEIKHEKSGAL